MGNLLRQIAVQSMIAMAFVFLCAGAWAQAKVTVESEISKSGSLVLEVRGVDDASVSATPVERTSPNGKQLYCAYDIDITKDGREWQPEPEQPAMVSMENTNFADGQLLDIYHEGANGLEFVATVASENGKITFPAHSFSVYIVAAAGDYARLKVNLHQADGTVVTIYVKKLDITQGDFNRIVYNPGIGTPADGVDCMGWIADENYDEESILDALTFDEVRDSIRNRVTSGVTDGTQLDFYAMLFKHYSVTYLAENESVLHTDVMPFRADADNSAMNYSVNALYTPASSTQNFEGWLVSTRSDGEHIYGHDDDFHNYANSTEIKVTGDVTFRVNVSEGHWLIYHENGKGATYKAADFVRATEHTVEPTLEMRRNGYTFVDWFLGAPTTEGDDPTGALFSFGGELTENTHVYAKWQANTTADYSVIIWKQNINGDGYDFEEIITISGNVGDLINTVSQQGSGTTSYARINSRNYQYPGFHLESFDQNVRIKTEGNAVLNVYYDRNEYTLRFQAYDYTYTVSTGDNDNSPEKYGLVSGAMARVYWKNGAFRTTNSNNGTVYTGIVYTRSSRQSWNDIKTITALYQQDISAHFPIHGTNGVDYTGYVWEPQSSRIFTSGSVPSLDAMREENTVFHAKLFGSGITIHMYYYTEALGSTGIQYQGRYFDEHQHVQISSSGSVNSTESEDFIEILGYDKLTSDPRYGSGGTVALNSGNRYTIKFYYTRRSYTINYMNGAYYDGNNNNLRTDGGTQIETKSGIAYGKDISSYSSHNPDPSHIPDGYVFEGWYADKTCTRPFVFTTMPEGGITVYAKWRQIQYRVFLHPNVDAEDISLNWGSDEQAMNFRINYGDKVSTPTGIRADYEFVGWYTDESFRRAFDQNAIVLNETTVRTAYNKTTDYTDPMDKYGNIGDDPYNSDAIGNNGGDRFWITKKYDLYGKWRAILRGAIGINVEYVVGDGGNAPTDTHLYQDHAYAIAGHASSHETKEFSHWVLQHWNGDEYVDTDTRIYPGATFIMLKSDARMDHAVWINPNDSTDIVPERYDPAGLHAPDRTHTVFKATYTIKLRAEYVDVEKPEYTYIKWLWNDGSDTERIDGTSTSSPDLGINVAVNPPVPTRAGYNFKGWYRSNESGATITECNPNFLFYNGAFYKESTYTNAVTAVAADKYGSTEYMYAIWEPVVDFTFGDLCPGDQIVLPTKNSADVLISGSWEAITGVVSGATYTASGLNDNLTFTPDPSTCAQETDFDITINTPSVGTSYDYIWKGTSADWNIPTNWYVYNNGYSIATEMPTTDHNIYIGPSQCVKTNWPSQSNEANAKNITIASDATLTVPAGKTLNIAGNLDNIGTLVANGTVVFCGETPSQDQTISNNITLANVRFNNRGGAIVPNGSMTIAGAATFTNGNVEGDVTFGENSSVENADDMTFYSFVDGTVTKAGNANGFTFPTGQDDVLGKIKVSSNATNVSVRYFHNSDGFDESEYPRWWNVADNCSDNDPRLDHVSNFEYWNVATSAPLSATLTVSAKVGDAHFNEHTVTYDAADIYGAFWNGSCWENVGGGNQSVSEGLHGTISVEVTLPATRAVSDKILSLGSIDHNTILPIELTSFSATCDGRSSLVKWTTATEKNNDYFSLERSDDAINFVEIARIAGAGNSIEPLNYNYTDYGVYGGENYYRLVQVDYDGTRTASEIIVVDCVEPDLDEPEVLAYPNPFNSELTLELDNFGNRPASIEVYDMLGRLVSVEKADAPQNRYETILNFSNLSNGTYTVRVSTADFVINRNVVKN